MPGECGKNMDWGNSLVAQRVKDRPCHCCGLGYCSGTGSLPGLVTSACCMAKTNNKNKKQTKKKTKEKKTCIRGQECVWVTTVAQPLSRWFWAHYSNMVDLEFLFKCFSFFIFYGCTHGMWKFPGQRSTRTAAVTMLDPYPTEPPQNSLVSYL